MSSDIGNLPLIETAKKSLWYPSVRNDYRKYRPGVTESNSMVQMSEFLHHALKAAVKGAIEAELCDGAARLAKDALEAGYVEFSCDLDLRSNGLPIVCRFLHPSTLRSYTRRLSYAAMIKPFGINLGLGDAVDLKIVIQSTILNTPGITYLRHRR